MRKAISAQFGVGYENVVIGTTHTHSGPSVAGMHSPWGGFDTEYYEEIFKPVLFASIAQAYENVEPVTMATAFGDSKIGINRRIQKEAALRKMQDLKKGPMYNMQSVQYEHCKAVVQSYEEGYVEREYDEFEQILFHLGDVAFATFAFELFGEIGLGGYGITMFKKHGVQAYADDADYSTIVSTVENINSLKR